MKELLISAQPLHHVPSRSHTLTPRHFTAKFGWQLAEFTTLKDDRSDPGLQPTINVLVCDSITRLSEIADSWYSDGS